MALNWNAGAWFGSQVGGSAWMLVAGLLALAHDSVTALTVLGVCALVNLAGWVLWRHRRLSCYASMQLLIACAGFGSLVATYVLDRAGVWLAIQSGPAVSAVSMYILVVCVTLGLLLQFYLQFRRRR